MMSYKEVAAKRSQQDKEIAVVKNERAGIWDDKSLGTAVSSSNSKLQRGIVACFKKFPSPCIIHDNKSAATFGFCVRPTELDG